MIRFMVEFFRRIGGFLNAMDARALTSFLVSALLLVFVGTMFIFGQEWLELGDDNALKDIMDRAASSPWALVGVISVYSLLALTGFPQILMIAATILAFRIFTGAFYAWVATMVSATLTFGFGHILGGQWVRNVGGARAHKTMDFLGRHGVLASGLIRLVPAAPFIVVNSAAGAAHIPMWKYWLGTGIGIMPKIAFVAVLRALAPNAAYLDNGIGGLLAFFKSRAPQDLALLILVIGCWLGFLFVMRKVYLRLRGQ